KTRRPHSLNEPSLMEMRTALEAKGVTLTDTALESADLEELIRLLYRNLDIMAATLAELPGTDIMRHRIDMGNSPLYASGRTDIHRRIKKKSADK
ncbi:MAG TPA: hypothetical protein VLS45_00975, partial [Methylomicrobium sp.]|nr:hypothetical protein [Methylomicrobium sp.]